MWKVVLMVIYIGNLERCMACDTQIIQLIPITHVPILKAGPHLTVNCLTDHRTWYNLQVGPDT